MDQYVPTAIRSGGDRLWGEVRLTIGGKHLTPEPLFHNTIQSPRYGTIEPYDFAL